MRTLPSDCYVANCCWIYQHSLHRAVERDLQSPHAGPGAAHTQPGGDLGAIENRDVLDRERLQFLCGTGLLSEPFLKNGNKVYGIEPNHEMLRAAEELLGDYPGFTGIEARAEATTLPDAAGGFYPPPTPHWKTTPATPQSWKKCNASSTNSKQTEKSSLSTKRT
ncbi:MAG: methyltransferase domain-containing protein [Anaerolineales bacterium]